MATIKVTHTINDVTNDAHNYLIAGRPNSFCHFQRVLMANCGCKMVTTGAIRCVLNFYICADSRRINGSF
jgi:hypothetical protein